MKSDALHPTDKLLKFVFGVMILCAVLSVFIIATSSAAVLVYGPNYNYSEVVLPNNSYVHQGENISQGYCYDLFGIYGFSGKVAHWKKEEDIGYEIPDKIVTLDDHPHHLTCIDKETFPEGERYQWDGVTCKEDTGWCKSGFGHGNNYVFAVVKKVPEWKTVDKTITTMKNVTITGEDGNETVIQVAVQETVQVREPVVDVIVNNVTTLIVPTTIPTATTPPTPPPTLLLPNSDHTPVPTTLEVVTPKSAQSFVPWLIAIALGIAVMCRRE